MAGGGYRGILAAVPTAQNLRSASRGGVHRQSKARRPTGRPVCSTLARRDGRDRSHAPRGNAAWDALRSAVDTRLESCAMVTRSVTGCIPTQSVGTINSQDQQHREQAHSHLKQSRPAHRCCFSPLIRSSVSSPLAFDLDLDLPHRKAERRFCAVGNPAWMAAGPRSRTGVRECRA
jgi:hypothetical protein